MAGPFAPRGLSKEAKLEWYRAERIRLTASNDERLLELKTSLPRIWKNFRIAAAPVFGITALIESVDAATNFASDKNITASLETGITIAAVVLAVDGVHTFLHRNDQQPERLTFVPTEWLDKPGEIE